MSSPTPPGRFLSCDKYCYFLFFILAGLVGVVIYNVGFYTDRFGQIEKTSNQYHLASSHFILKIINNASRMEKRVLTSEVNGPSGLVALQERLSDPTQTTLYLMDQDFVKLLKLQRKFNYSKYEKSLKRLGKHIHNLRESWRSPARSTERMLISIKALQISSEQLYRLHFFSFQNLTQEAHDIRKEHNLWFVSIAGVLMCLGIFALFKIKQWTSHLQSQNALFEETLKKQDPGTP